MDGVREDLIVPLDGVDTGHLLESWRWLIPEAHRPIFATAFGDLFLSGPGGQVLWLDIGDGQLRTVATDLAEFHRLAADPENGDLWFGHRLVDRLRATGRTLGPGECYCFLLLPMLGGKYEPANFRVYGVVHHFQIWGPIHEKLRDIPDGTTIEFVIT